MSLKNGRTKLIYVLIFIVVAVVATLAIIFTIANKNESKVSKKEDEPTPRNEVRPADPEEKPSDSRNHFRVEEYDGEDYYIIEDDYEGEYNIQYTRFEKFISPEDNYDEKQDELSGFEIEKVLTYEEYEEFCEKWDFDLKFNDEQMNYAVVSYIAYGSPNLTARLAGVESKEKTTTLYVWDEAYGVTADVTGYAIFVPVDTAMKKIKIQKTMTEEEFNDMAGILPNTDASYSAEDNKILAKNAYIETNDEEVNEIFNKMLDAIVKENTIEIEAIDDDGKLKGIYDLRSANSKVTWKDDVFGDYVEYAFYAEEYGKKYAGSEDNSHYSVENGQKRELMIYSIALRFQWGLVIDFANHDINPYYFGDDDNKKNGEYSVEKEDNYYVISYKYKDYEYNDEYKMYINKDNYLLEKSSAKNKTYNNEYEYKYSDKTVTIPEKVYKNATEVPVALKPIIYLYPEKEEEISVKLGRKENITISYPKYTNGWKVWAKTNGDLKDLDTNRNLYSLYYECDNAVNFKVEKDGFIVKGKDAAKFLEEKLAILGLSDREAEEFIVYWLPKLEANKYNYIRFATDEELENNMPLIISPKPDTTIRILMTFKGLDKPIDVTEQKLEKKTRNGYTAVEWGGTEIK